MCPGSWVDAGHGQFEEGEEGVEAVLGGIDPNFVGASVGRSAVDEGPVYDCDNEGVCYDCAPEKVVEGLEGSREAVEEGGSAMEGVREGVDCGDAEVACDSPETEDWLALC